MRGLPDYSKIQPRYQSYMLSSGAIVCIVYWVICLVIAGLLILSWSFVIEISTLSPGIIRPYAEISTIRSAFNGRIKQSFARENQLVQEGDTLYSLETEALTIRRKFLSDKLNEVRHITADLKVLTSNAEKKSLNSLVCQQSWTTFLQRMSEANTRLKKAQSDYKRNLKLYNQMVIAEAEFETYRYELDRAKNELALTRKSQLSQWQNELTNYERDMRSIEVELAEVDREMKSMFILSPITGTIQRFAGIYAGTYVYANQDLAQISPETDLIVEAYVSPGHIGLLRIGMKVRFLVDAFNYNQWGFGEGSVLDISNDVYLVNDTPVFKIRCSLNRNYLELGNGYKGILKKGMSLKARFIVTERTLWQLLYDQTDDWLNPGR
jgi:membrane fusion protein, peptide pheromone/bacteriocin exporter